MERVQEMEVGAGENDKLVGVQGQKVVEHIPI